MKVRAFVLATAIARGGLAISPVQAHDSAARYDFKTPVVIQGSVKEIRVANPHMRRVVHVSDAKDARDELEAHSLNNIHRRGWRILTLPPGVARTHLFQNATSTLPAIRLTFVTLSNQT